MNDRKIIVWFGRIRSLVLMRVIQGPENAGDIGKQGQHVVSAHSGVPLLEHGSCDLGYGAGWSQITWHEYDSSGRAVEAIRILKQIINEANCARGEAPKLPDGLFDEQVTTG